MRGLKNDKNSAIAISATNVSVACLLDAIDARLQTRHSYERVIRSELNPNPQEINRKLNKTLSSLARRQHHRKDLGPKLNTIKGVVYKLTKDVEWVPAWNLTDVVDRPLLLKFNCWRTNQKFPEHKVTALKNFHTFIGWFRDLLKDKIVELGTKSDDATFREYVVKNCNFIFGDEGNKAMEAVSPSDEERNATKSVQEKSDQSENREGRVATIVRIKRANRIATRRARAVAAFGKLCGFPDDLRHQLINFFDLSVKSELGSATSKYRTVDVSIAALESIHEYEAKVSKAIGLLEQTWTGINEVPRECVLRENASYSIVEKAGLAFLDLSLAYTSALDVKTTRAAALEFAEKIADTALSQFLIRADPKDDADIIWFCGGIVCDFRQDFGHAVRHLHVANGTPYFVDEVVKSPELYKEIVALMAKDAPLSLVGHPQSVQLDVALKDRLLLTRTMNLEFLRLIVEASFQKQIECLRRQVCCRRLTPETLEDLRSSTHALPTPVSELHKLEKICRLELVNRLQELTSDLSDLPPNFKLLERLQESVLGDPERKMSSAIAEAQWQTAQGTSPRSKWQRCVTLPKMPQLVSVVDKILGGRRAVV